MAPKKTTVATHEDLAICKSDVVSIISQAFISHEKVEGIMYGQTLETLKRIESQLTDHIDTMAETNKTNRENFHSLKTEITAVKLKSASTDGAFSLAKWIVASVGGMGGLASILYFIAQR